MRTQPIALLLFYFTATLACVGGETIEPVFAGSDTPSMGHSVFDAVFTVPTAADREYAVPYPFAEIVRRLDEFSGNSSGEDTHLLQMVLIPLGRCIQRHAAAPDYFASPPIVLAANSELKKITDERPIFIKDRLFLGYQREANAIEVISYNELAGRFEFQVVDNYGPGLTPSVRYAPRKLCISCHQNAGPIFPRVQWSETSARKCQTTCGVLSDTEPTKPTTSTVPRTAQICY